jgi:hypothetical protein
MATDDAQQALRTQFSELIVRSRTYSGQIWQVPLAYLAAAGVVLPKLQGSALGLVALAAGALGVALFLHLFSVNNARHAAVEYLAAVEQDLGLRSTAKDWPLQTWPLLALVGIASLAFLTLGVMVLRHSVSACRTLYASSVVGAGPAGDLPLFVPIAEVLSSVVIAAFAVLQWRLSDKAERARLAERRADKLAKEDGAFATVRAEWFRIWTVSKQWAATDLADPALVASLSPDDILPRDWASLTQQLGQLGLEAAFLGSFALAMAYDAGKQARALFMEVEAYNRQRPDDPAAATEFDEQHVPRLKKAAAELQETATEAADLLQDAMEHAPPAKVVRFPTFNKRLISKTAKAIAAEIEAKSSGSQSQSP